MIRQKLKKQLQEIRKLRMKVEERLSHLPSATLTISMVRGRYPQYYYRPPKGKRIYLRKNQSDLIRDLAQHEYDAKLLEKLVTQENLIEGFLKSYHPEVFRTVLDDISEHKLPFIQAEIPRDKDLVEKWYADHPGGQNPKEFKSTQYTNKNEAVRSKSEKIIADKLNELGIPYVYEPSLYVEGMGIVYPDFLILNIRTGKTIIHEHLGMMDNADYCKNAIRKLDGYQRAGYRMGEDLFITMECSLISHDTMLFQRIAEEYYM